MADLTTLAKHVSSDALKNITEWLSQPKYAQYKSEIETLINEEDWRTLEDSFFKVVEFGTGGRRGTTGVGSNRINRVTMGESAQAFCLYAAEQDSMAAQKGVVIACDTRLSSPELSQYVAGVCVANGFKVYIFDNFRATPELSFAVRHLGAAIGIVISASHNPPADNGFKAYWNDGAQLVAPHDKGVLKKATEISEILYTDYEQAVSTGSITVIGEAVDNAYVDAAVSEAVGTHRDVAIVYSPLHGAGQTNVLPVLKKAGFTNISLVEDQMTPDGNFPTVENGKPNPEEKAANNRAVAQLLAERADIAITNDPDADRIGVVVRVGDDPVYLNGNQSAVLAADYALKQLQARGELTAKHYIAKTIVTTDMLNALAQHYGITIYDNMLVGFKYIGELLLNKENTDETFVVGGEESYGLLKGTYARDKDGAAGALLLAEYAAELKAEGRTLYDRLVELYGIHGLYLERLDNVVSPGADGFARMQQVMQKLRTDAPREVGGHAVTAILDYASLEKTELTTGATSAIDCLAGNVVVLEFGDHRRRITVRPSGTEAKIKFYVQWFEEIDVSEPAAIDALSTITKREIEGLSRELEGVLFAA